MRRLPVALSAILLAAAAAGCGEASDSTPIACLAGSGAYAKALRGVPGEVALGDGTPISGCLVENQTGGELASVGAAMVEAATRLNGAARAEPGGEANLELGYLLGAAQRGAEGTDGIHAELLRRLASAARYAPDGRPLPAAFLRTYREGFDAGQVSG